MTTISTFAGIQGITAEGVIRHLSGKWKLRILSLANSKPVRFNSLLRQIEGSNKQAIAIALKELTGCGLLSQQVKRLKPLHIEYELSPKGSEVLNLISNISSLSPENDVLD